MNLKFRQQVTAQKIANDKQANRTRS